MKGLGDCSFGTWLHLLELPLAEPDEAAAFFDEPVAGFFGAGFFPSERALSNLDFGFTLVFGCALLLLFPPR